MAPSDEYLRANNLSFSYQKSDFSLKNISISFSRGEFAALVGENGSGKTTLGKLMVGILEPDSGEILINGKLSQEMSLGQVAKRVGYLFQQPGKQLFTSRVEEEIGFALRFRDQDEELIEKKVTGVLEEFSLADLKDSSPYKLSRGEKQRLALATILVNEPSFLILDEPTTGLDVVRKKDLANILKDMQQKGMGIVVISHDEDFVADNADRVLKVSGGGLFEL